MNDVPQKGGMFPKVVIFSKVFFSKNELLPTERVMFPKMCDSQKQLMLP